MKKLQVCILFVSISIKHYLAASKRCSHLTIAAASLAQQHNSPSALHAHQCQWGVVYTATLQAPPAAALGVLAAPSKRHIGSPCLPTCCRVVLNIYIDCDAGTHTVTSAVATWSPVHVFDQSLNVTQMR